GALIVRSPPTGGASIAITTAGDVRVETGASGDALISVPSVSDSSGFGSIDGTINVVAHGNVVVAGQIIANSTRDTTDGGFITVTADGSLAGTGTIGADAGANGVGGR